jgi:hypothetical protein
MRNYQYLDIPNHEIISAQVLEHLNSTYDLSRFVFWNDIDHDLLLSKVPLLFNLMNTLALTTRFISIIKTKNSGHIHVDYGDGNSCRTRILWPIKNCIGSVNKFYSVRREWLELKHLPNGKPYFTINNPTPLEQLDEFELNRPVVFNPEVGHAVYCNPKYQTDRISMNINTEE